MVDWRCIIAPLIVFTINHNYVFSKHLATEADKFLVKSFVSRSGDMIDCVNIYDQPAFRHPLLKDHKMQMKPTNAPDIDVKRSWSYVKEMMTFRDSDRCTDGTIPIKRVALPEDRTSEYHSDGYNRKTRDSYFRKAKLGINLPPDDSFCGAVANISVHNPPTLEVQTNSAMIRLGGGPRNDHHAIYVGWAVYPKLYNDTKTHFSTYWKGYNRTGCYDLLCPGFVQTNDQVPLGATITDVSDYNKLEQVSVHIKVHQDAETLNWWLLLSAEEIPLGYWPRELFTHLDECATSLSFGGTVKNQPGISNPLMGYGFFPSYDTSRSAFVNNIQYIGRGGLAVTPWMEQTFKLENSPNCYRVLNIGSTLTGYTIAYGGTGGQNC